MSFFNHFLRAAIGMVALCTALDSLAQTNPTARSIPFTEAFPTGTFSTYPSGFRGWQGVSGAATTTQALAEASAPNANATLSASAPASGGAGGLFGTSGRVAVNTSSNATTGVNQLMMAFNATDRFDITLEYSVYSQIANPRTIGVVAQYRVGTSGGWTTINPTSGSNPYSQVGGSTGLQTTVSATLPSDCNYQPVVQVRWAIWRGTESGNSSALAFDDISVGGTLDSDEDGDPDSTDPCPLLAYVVPGSGCDDGNPNTIGDVITPGCVCVGTVANDDCANSTYLGGAQAYGACASTAGSTSGATPSGGSCGAAANDVWYYVYASPSANTFVDLVPGTAAGMGIEVYAWDGCVTANSVYCATGNSHTVAMVPSQPYAIRVFTTTPGDFTICVSAPQPNDECVNAQNIGNYNAGDCPANGTAGTTAGATPSGGACGAGSNDVWYYFYSNSSLYSNVELTAGTAAGLGIQVFEAACGGSSVYCASGNAHAVPVTPGQYYYMRVFSSTPGDFSVCVSNVVQPANDECVGSTYLGGAQSYGSCSATSGTTVGGSASGGSCGAAANDVWYYVYASGNANTFVDLVPGTAAGMGIEVYDWDGCVTANSVYCATGNSHTVAMVPSQPYAIRVFTTTPGDFTICVSAPQPNDECVNAQNIGNYNAGDCPANGTAGTTAGATPSGGACGAGSNDVWYYFYSNSSLYSNVELTAGTAAGLGIQVFEGACGGSSVYCASGNAHAVPVTPAQYYYMRVFSSTPGDFSVCVSNVVQPANDECAGSAYLGGAQSYGSCSATSGTTVGGSASGGSCGATANDVWYYVYASPSANTFVDLVPGTAAGMGIEVYDWDGCVTANSVYCATGNSHTVAMVPSQPYAIRVFTTTPGDFTICVSAPPANDDCVNAAGLSLYAYGDCPANGTAGTTLGSTQSGTNSCNGSAVYDVWYQVYSYGGSSIFVDLSGVTAAGIGIEVLDGCGGNVVYCASGTSHTVLTALNTYYYIKVFSTAPGVFSICTSTPVSNNECDYAAGLGLYAFGDCPVNGTAGTTVASTQSGTNSCNGSAAYDVWYQVYSSGGSSIFVDLNGVTATGIGIEVFDGCGGNMVYCASGTSHTVPTALNTYYYIKVFSTAPGAFSICTSTPVSNNECDYAAGLGLYAYGDCPANGTAGTTVGSTQSGTNSCNGSAAYDVWYQVYSSGGSSIFVDLSGVTAAGIGIEVFDGCGGNMVYCASGTSHTVPTALNTYYYIKVFSTAPGAFSICTSTPVSNNECDYAAGLSLYAYGDCPANGTAGTTVGSTQSGTNSCNGSAAQDVWYQVYSYGGSAIFVDLSGVTATGIGIEVFDGCGGNVVYCASGTSHTVPTALNTYYYIKVFSTAPGAFAICTSTPVANNECEYAAGLSVHNNGDCPANATAGTTVASTQSGVNACEGGAAHDVWYTVYSGNSASLVVSLASTGAGGLGLEVFDGCPGTSVYCANGLSHTVTVTPYLTYYLKVYSATAGGYTVCVNYPPPVYDCLGVLGGSALPGTACTDNNTCTTGDTWNNSCQCVGTALPDSDGDGLCDAQDSCPSVPGQVGSGCDDGDPCTLDDALNGSCTCAGSNAPDSDGDGTCDGLDPCPYLANLNNGDACDDGNGSTTGDVVSGCTCVGVVSSGGLTLSEGWAQVNGNVETLAHDTVNDILYIGGQFTRVGGPVESYGAKVNITDGTADLAFPNPNGPVFAAIADGTGGWYIAGDFTAVGGIGRNRAARINADGSLHAWNPNVSGGFVDAILTSGSTVYLGGTFTSVGGQSRSLLAAVDASTGIPTSWNPGVTGYGVYALAVSGTTLYVGGYLSALGGQPRNNLGAVSTTTGLATAWNPSPDGFGIENILVHGSSVFVCGFFNNIGGQVRNSVAALNNTNGAATAWNASVAIGGTVYEMAVTGGNLVIAGGFDQVGGQPRINIAQVSIATGAVAPWSSNVHGGAVLGMFVSGSSAYLVGYFVAVQGQSRHHAAEVDLSTGALSGWDPAPGPDLVYAVCQSGSALFVGGRFVTLGGVQRNCLAALDGTTGQPLPWNPGVAHPGSPVVWDISLSGDSLLYVAGQFVTVAGAPRTYLAAVRTSNGTVSAWAPNPNNITTAVRRAGNSVYVSGAFTSVGGQARNSIACLSATSGAATAWNPGMSGSALDMEIKGDTLFVGGYFTTVGGVGRSNLAAVSRNDASTLNWTVNTNESVQDLDLVGDRLYVAGTFSSIGGQSRNYVALIDRVSGAVAPWSPWPNGQVNAVAADPSGAYLGGYFQSVNGLGRSSLASVSTFSGSTSGWVPAPNSSVLAQKISDGRLFVGGDFSTMGGQPRSGIAVFTLPTVAEARLSVRAHLEGPYNSATGLMSDALRGAGLLPVQEPYTALGYGHVGSGSEFTTPTVLAATGSNAIVDWVMLELRDAGNSASVVATRAALVQRDGDIVDVDGTSPVTFNVAAGNYYVAVRHRNHFGAMAANTVALSLAPASVDLSSVATSTFGSGARKSVTGIVPTQALWAGNVNFDGQLQYVGAGNDRDPILLTVGSTTPNNTVNNTYSTRDVNMDGSVKYVGLGNDRDPILLNVGNTTPNNVRMQQLP